jgi:hypothetical protein
MGMLKVTISKTDIRIMEDLVMARNKFRDTAEKLLNSTERQALSKVSKVHQPMLKELEKWKEQREKLENTLLDQIERIGQFLEPYQDPTRVQQTLMGLAGQRPSRASSSKKKTTSGKKAASLKKPSKRSAKPKGRLAKKSK